MKNKKIIKFITVILLSILLSSCIIFLFDSFLHGNKSCATKVAIQKEILYTVIHYQEKFHSEKGEFLASFDQLQQEFPFWNQFKEDPNPLLVWKVDIKRYANYVAINILPRAMNNLSPAYFSALYYDDSTRTYKKFVCSGSTLNFKANLEPILKEGSPVKFKCPLHSRQDC
jgi:hypothetical protein